MADPAGERHFNGAKVHRRRRLNVYNLIRGGGSGPQILTQVALLRVTYPYGTFATHGHPSRCPRRDEQNLVALMKHSSGVVLMNRPHGWQQA